jgi:hypothetical protein
MVSGYSLKPENEVVSVNMNMHPPMSSLALLVRDRRLRMVSGYSLKPENEVSEHAPAGI